MSRSQAKPIFSTCDEDPNLTVALDRFVIGLAERVDTLQDAELDGDLPLLERLATELAAQASELGYAPMREIAQAVASACHDEKVEDAQAAMVELTDIAARIRRGHRGAA
ncbi:MAG: hypothetical protein QF570_22920 [Myxococcota bacterium]|jgi:hypothetical protein|nr:hypothetical protein [Myxococcota bacterium]